MNTASDANRRSKPTPVGELRPSQMLYTFGVGSIVDLPRLAVMVMGLDDWEKARTRPIEEARLLAAVRAELGETVEELRSPPLAIEERNTLSEKYIGVPVAAFPRYMVCPRCRYLGPAVASNPLIELKVNPYRMDRTAYVHANCRFIKGGMPDMIPVRFLVACKHGHLDDFPWQHYVHRGSAHCNGQLFLYEFGFGEVAEITIKCDTCQASRKMAEAFGEEGKDSLLECSGRRPHLRDRVDSCGEPSKTILLGASNSWFPLSVSLLHLPLSSDRVSELLDLYWGELKEITEPATLTFLRRRGELSAFDEYDIHEFWDAIETKRNAGAASFANPSDIKTPEWKVFRAGTAPPSRDLELRTVAPPIGYEWCIEKTVLVEKVRQVSALLGFTRIESPGEFAEAREVPDDQRAPLCRGRPTWVPASEVRGEGIFLEFKRDVIAAWAAKPSVKKREAHFLAGHKQWRASRGLPPEEHFPGIGYVLIHSLSHALMRQISIECGYSAAGIQERLYWTGVDGVTEDMAGLLIYTSAPDSEGTLGGLVSLGEPGRLGAHLDQALETMGLCASDPLCAEHLPVKDGVTLFASACHACQFVPETACERSNKYLDRALLVDTTETDDLAFFPSA